MSDDKLRAALDPYQLIHDGGFSWDDVNAIAALLDHYGFDIVPALAVPATEEPDWRDTLKWALGYVPKFTDDDFGRDPDMYRHAQVLLAASATDEAACRAPCEYDDRPHYHRAASATDEVFREVAGVLHSETCAQYGIRSGGTGFCTCSPHSKGTQEARFAASATEERRKVSGDYGDLPPGGPIYAASATEEPTYADSLAAKMGRLTDRLAAPATDPAVSHEAPASEAQANSGGGPTQDTAQLDWRDSR